MSFIRPEAAAAIRSAAEPVIFAAIAGFCFWKGIAAASAGAWLGLTLLLPGALAAFAAIGTAERALVARRSRRAGPGMVRVQEGRIIYLGPHGGATAAIDGLIRVDIVTERRSAFANGARWELTDEEGQLLSIPASAAGADALLDVLGALPGFNNMAVVLAMQGGSSGRHAVWQRRSETAR